MSGGMRIDPQGLPLPMQEQLATKILAQISAPDLVAGGKKTVKVPVRRLRFPSRRAVERYRELRTKEQNGELAYMACVTMRGNVVAFYYRSRSEGTYVKEPTDIWRTQCKPAKNIW